MKKQHLLLSVSLAMAVLLVLPTGCKKDSSPSAPKISTLVAGDIDLNGATSPNNVPTTPTIIATFTENIDPASVNNNSVTMIQAYDNTNIPLDVQVNGKELTITPQSELGMGALYKLDFTADIQSTGGLALTAFERTFTTEGLFAPAGAVAYWNFENNANDQVGTYNPITGGITDITYGASHNSASGMAAQFNGTTSLIEIANGDQLMNTNDFSLSLWVKEDSTGKRDQFVMGLSAWQGFQVEINNNGNGGLGECKLAAQYSLVDGTSTSQDLWFNGGNTGTTKDNGGWKGWTYCRDLTSDNGTGVNGLLAEKWAHLVFTYNSSSKVGTVYINGQMMKQQDFNLYGSDNALYNATGLVFAGNAGNNALAFGFIQDKTDPTITDSWAAYSDPANGHFQGMLDDVSIYHKVLTENEISLMYNSGKP